MGIVLSSNIDLQGGLPLDSRYGPYSSTTQANQSIVTANRFVGLTVGIVTGTTTYNGLQLTEADGGIADYWYYTGITDSDLVIKEGGQGDAGSSGSSGTSGSSGSSGTSGSSGSSGTSGSSGSSGTSGSSGSSGTSGSSGSSGTSGSSGSSGTSGSSGSSGTSGSSGSSGTSGSSGSSGTSGFLALTGDTIDGVITYNGSGGSVESNLLFNGDNDTLTISGDSYTYGNDYKKSADTEITTNGNHNIITTSISSISGSSLHYNYYVEEQSTGGFRTGKIMAAVNRAADTTVYTDNSTVDGTANTNDIVFSTVISGNNLILRATTTNSTTWYVKVGTEIIF